MPPDLFHYEMPEDGAGGMVASEGEPLAESVAEEPWVGPSQDEWGEVRQTLGYLAEYVQSQQQPPQAEQAELPQFDPFEPDYPQRLAQYVQEAVQQAVAPIMDWQQGQRLSEAEERALDILEDIVSNDGELTEQETAFQMARALADVFLPEESQRHGFGPQAAEAALQRSVKMLRTRDEAVAKSAIERHMNQLTNLSGAGHELAAAGSAPQNFVMEPGGDELSVVRKYGGIVPGIPTPHS